MNNRVIEKISTGAGVILLAMLAVFGILGCFEIVSDIDFFSTARAAEVWTVIPLITSVLIFCFFLVSTMLNISRIANRKEYEGLFYHISCEADYIGETNDKEGKYFNLEDYDY